MKERVNIIIEYYFLYITCENACEKVLAFFGEECVYMASHI